jgi:hypothetical protein
VPDLQDKQDLRCHEVNQGWGKVRRDWRDRPSSHWPQSSGLHSLSRHSGLASFGPRPGVIITSICPGGDRQEEWQECRVVTTVQPGPGRTRPHQARVTHRAEDSKVCPDDLFYQKLCYFFGLVKSCVTTKLYNLCIELTIKTFFLHPR